MDAVPYWEFRAWCEWKVEEFKDPCLTDYQLMRVAMLLERSIYKQEDWQKLGLYDLGNQLVKFKSDVETPQPVTPPREPTEEEKRAATERWKALTHFDPERAAKMRKLKEQRGH